MTHKGDDSSEGQLVITTHPDGSVTYSYIKNAVPTGTATTATTETTKVAQPIATRVAPTKQTNNKKLPQTGEQQDNTSAIVGMSLLGMMLGWFGFKRKKRDED